VGKQAMLVLAVLSISTACDFYWGYHATHSVDDGIIQVLRGLLVLAIFFGPLQITEIEVSDYRGQPPASSKPRSGQRIQPMAQAVG
jgi:hypothetical protein